MTKEFICIDDCVDILGFGNGSKELTYGRLYKITGFYEKKPHRPQMVSLINDLGVNNDYLFSRFVTLSEW